MMRVVKLTSETDAQVDRSQFAADDWKAVADARYRKSEEIKASLGAPIDLSTVVAVQHDQKTDRYQVKFSGGEKTLLLKATDEVAAFVAEHLRKAGSWIGRMDQGVLTDVYLITLE